MQGTDLWLRALDRSLHRMLAQSMALGYLTLLRLTWQHPAALLERFKRCGRSAAELRAAADPPQAARAWPVLPPYPHTHARTRTRAHTPTKTHARAPTHAHAPTHARTYAHAHARTRTCPIPIPSRVPSADCAAALGRRAQRCTDPLRRARVARHRVRSYEAVHPMRSMDELKARLGLGRRIYAFMHPALVDEPLVFVNIALTAEPSTNIQQLLQSR